MTPIDALAITATITLATVVFAAVGAGGGYLISVSELFEAAQQRWTRNADMLDAALNNELIEWETIWQAELDRAETEPGYQPDMSFMPWGSVDGDTDVIGELEIEPGRWTRIKWRTKWVWYAMLRCNLCSGWHVIEAAMAWTAGGLLWFTPTPWWVIATAGPVVWLASGAVHTIVSGTANNKEVW